MARTKPNKATTMARTKPRKSKPLRTKPSPSRLHASPSLLAELAHVHIKPNTATALTLAIGTEPHRKIFHLNRHHITTHSGLFQEAASKAPEPSSPIVFPNMRASDFAAYAQYHSLADIDLCELADRQWEEIKPPGCVVSEGQKIHMRVATLLGYWVLGSTVRDHIFRNAVIDAILTQDLSGQAGAAIVQSAGQIEGDAGKKSGLWRLFGDVMAAVLTKEFVDEWGDRWDKESTVEILKCVVARRGIPSGKDAERYYEFESKEAK